MAQCTVVHRIALALLLSIFTAGTVCAEPHAPVRAVNVALLLGSSGPGDKGFNDAALAGLDAAKKEGRLTVAVRLAPRADEYGATIDRLAADAPDLVIGVGFVSQEPLRTASARHPEIRFLLLDAELADIPNVKSVTFRAEEGSFLAGVVAALESKHGRVGFVGGMENPTIQAFECGWETGVRWATKERFLDVRGRAVYIGTTPEAFSNPAAGEELSHAMITQQGVDVLYAAAGASGLGVIKAARQAKVKAIGVDADQHAIAPETVITSMRKRLDRAVETTIAEVRRQAFHGGAVTMSLANGGVDLVLPGRLAPSTVKLVEKARAALVSGKTPACVKEEDRVPAWNFPPRPAAS
jgi:basic membrane protein A